MGIRLITIEEFVTRAEQIHGKGEYDYSKVIYKNNRTKIKIRHIKCGKWFDQTPNGHLRGQGCLYCSRRDRRKTTEQFIKDAEQIHGKGEYDYSKVKYEKANKKVKIRHVKCGKWFDQTPNNHLNGQGCPRPLCNGCIRTSTSEEFVKKAKRIHGKGEYDYSKVKYEKANKKVKIRHVKCGKWFDQTPNNHLNGGGCPHCNGCIRKNKKQFIKDAEQIHGKGEYDYSKVIYKNNRKKVKIRHVKCNKWFDQTPSSHLEGRGCPYCHINARKNTEWFIEKAEKKYHKDEYDYSKVKYKGSFIKVKIKHIKCNKWLERTPSNHLKGVGCPYCKNRVSKPETHFLNYLKIPNKPTNRQVGLHHVGLHNRYKVDGYIKKTHTAYEFLGDFWHGNLEHFHVNDINKVSKHTYGDLHRTTFERFDKLIEHTGCTIKYIWESDWNRFADGITHVPKIQIYNP